MPYLTSGFMMMMVREKTETKIPPRKLKLGFRKLKLEHQEGKYDSTKETETRISLMKLNLEYHQKIPCGILDSVLEYHQKIPSGFLDSVLEYQQRIPSKYSVSLMVS